MPKHKCMYILPRLVGAVIHSMMVKKLALQPMPMHHFFFFHG